MDGAAALRLAEIVPAELVDELLHFERILIGLGLQPLVLAGEVLLPEQPDLARLLREQVLVAEPVHRREVPGSRSDQQHVIGRLHHQLRHLRRVLHPFERRDGAGAAGRSVHHAGVELDDPFFVRDPAVPHGHVRGVVFDDVDAGDRRIQGVGALLHAPDGELHRAQAVCGRDGDRPRRLLLRTTRLRQRRRRCRRSQESSPREGHSRSSDAMSRPSR